MYSSKFRWTCKFRWTWFLPSILLALILAACGGTTSDQSSGAVSATPRPVATMPAARFTAVSQQQVFTDTVRSATPAADSATGEATATPAAAAGPDLSRGATVYENRCASCHGEQGEGVADKGNDIRDFELTLSEFDTLLRTGANGRLGPDHLFGPSAVSRSGMEVLHAYVQSLAD